MMQRLALLALAGAMIGCSSNAAVGHGVTQIVAVTGANLLATVGTVLAISPSIRVEDDAGKGIAGVTVRFSVTAGAGTVLGDSVTTDASGIATVGQWVMGTVPGVNTLHVAAPALSLSTAINATAVPGAAVSIRSFGQQGFIAMTGQTVTPAPAVQALDSYGNPVPGTVVTFIVGTGGGGISGGTATADVAGVARLASWTLGIVAGANSLLARVPTGASLTFTAQALASKPVLQASSPITQSGYLQFPVATIPRVEVLDGLGRALVGVPVTFTVSSGDGTVTGAIAITGSNGVASPADWRLGLASGSLTASVGLGANPMTFSATGVVAPFLIDLRFLTAISNDQRDAFVAAATRWMGIITAHLTSVPLSLPAGACTALQPTLSETVRDVVIFVEVAPIDGPGGVLGSGVPCVSRSESGLTVVGTMQFDTADLPTAIANGQLVPIITHEMAHVLGFGTDWSTRNLLTDLGNDDLRFTGAETAAIWPPFATALAFAGTTPPVENLFGTGTAGSHWRKSVFDAELMTGFIEAPGVPMPLSKVTIASMKDLGYAVDYSQADLFVGNLRATGSPVASPSLLGERITGPRFQVSPSGAISPIVP
jgi:hypothetical protein